MSFESEFRAGRSVFRTEGAPTSGSLFKKKKTGFDALLGQAQDMVKGAVPGLIGSGLEAGESVLNMASLPATVIDSALNAAGAPEGLREGVAALDNPFAYPSEVANLIAGHDATTKTALNPFGIDRDLQRITSQEGPVLQRLEAGVNHSLPVIGSFERGVVAPTMLDVKNNIDYLDKTNAMTPLGLVYNKKEGWGLHGAPITEAPYVKAYQEGELLPMVIRHATIGAMAAGGVAGAAGKVAETGTAAEAASLARPALAKALEERGIMGYRMPAAEAEAVAGSQIPEASALANRIAASPRLRGAAENISGSLGSAADAANQVAALPFKAPLLPARAVDRVISRIAAVDTEGMGALRTGGVDAAEFAAKKIANTKRLVGERAQRAADRATSITLQHKGGGVDRRHVGINSESMRALAPEEQSAVMAVTSFAPTPELAAGFRRQLDEAGAGLPEGSVARQAAEIKMAPTITGQAEATPEIIRAADDYYKVVDPERRAAMDRAIADMRVAKNPEEVRRVGSEGESIIVSPETQRLRREEEMGNDYMYRKAEADLTRMVGKQGRETFKYPQAAKQWGEREKLRNTPVEERGPNWEEHMNHAEELWRDTLADHINKNKEVFVPPNWRPAHRAARKLKETAQETATQYRKQAEGAKVMSLRTQYENLADEFQLAADEVLTNLGDIAQMGDTPIHWATGRGRTMNMPPEMFMEIKRPKDSGLIKSVGENRRKGSHVVFDTELQLNDMMLRSAQYHHNVTVRKMIAESGGLRMNEVRNQITSQLQAAGAEKKSSYRVAHEGLVNGTFNGTRYVAVDPVSFKNVTNLSKLENNTLYIPRSLSEAFKDAHNTRLDKTLWGQTAERIDKGTGYWKTAMLPFSPKWLVGNVFGNMMMAASTVGGKALMDPAVWRKAWDITNDYRTKAEGDKLLKRTGEFRKDVAIDPYGASVTRRGQSELDASYLGGGANPSTGKFRRMSDWAYHKNQIVDDFGHAFVYAAKEFDANASRAMADTMLKQGRISKAEHTKMLKDKVMSSEQMVSEANRVMGDFSTQLSYGERNVIRRVMPFYPWYKHITKLALKLPVTNPMRLLWTMNLANLYDEEGPDWLQSAIKGPGGTFIKGNWDVYTGGLTNSPLLNPKTAGGALSPALQLPYAIATGFNPRTGKAMVRKNRKEGTLSPSEGLGYLMQQFPQTTMLRNLIEGNKVRYDTGEERKIAGRPIEQTAVGGRLAPVAYFLTGMGVDKPNMAALRKREADKARQGRRKKR